MEPGDVVRLGERAHEDHILARLTARDRLGCAEHDLALSGAGRRSDAADQDVVGGSGVEGREQERLKTVGVDREQRFVLTEQFLGDGIDGETNRCLGWALGGTGLE